MMNQLSWGFIHRGRDVGYTSCPSFFIFIMRKNPRRITIARKDLILCSHFDKFNCIIIHDKKRHARLFFIKQSGQELVIKLPTELVTLCKISELSLELNQGNKVSCFSGEIKK